MTLALFCIALGILGAGAAFGWWARGAIDHDDLVALDEAKARRQGLATVYALRQRDDGGAA